MNTVALTGRFVYAPELRQTTNGTSYIYTRVAVSRNDKNRTTDFFNIKAWNSTAKFIGQYFQKGDPIEIRGRLETSERTDSEGKKSTEVYILVDEVSFTLKPAERTEPTAAEQAPTKPEEVSFTLKPAERTEPTAAEQAPTKPENDMSQSVLDAGIAELLDDTPGSLPFDL